ncbi:MAG TPA: (5-formylfuran-3-yl)methyl phosphate synthase [Aestuariivirgaceae bacterium]|nr:(5-formylfuran-3-yl)methyl phosphate synthase [Aestuariivirgaceae bacterium]
MTLMLATVTGPEEAEIAIAGGADIIDFAAPDNLLGALDIGGLGELVRSVGGRRRTSASIGTLPADPRRAIELVRSVAGTGVDSVLVPLPALDQPLLAFMALPRGLRLIAVLLADRGADLACIGALAEAGFAGAILDIADKSGGRLLDHADPGTLARFVDLCRGRGLVGGFAGGLEAPDVPRLLALKPHVLGFRRALRQDHDHHSPIDPEAAAAIRRLIPPHEQQAGSAGADHTAPSDRLLVRDLVLDLSIGAYRHERGRPQRVRFNVIADVSPPSGRGDDIGNVFSYDVILDTIRALAENRHFNLVETLAEEIAARLLEHAPVAAVTVRVEKLDVASAVVGVEILRRKR